jgi:hypothetical protein
VVIEKLAPNWWAFIGLILIALGFKQKGVKVAVTTPRPQPLVILVALVALTAACGPAPQRPTRLKLHRPGVSGLPVDVTFRIQNPNPKPLPVERFDYEVIVNAQSVGKGFVAEPILLESFKETEVKSRFNINYFSIPGAVKQVLNEDRMDALVRGTFYVKGRFGTTRLPYEAVGAIPMGKDDEDRQPGR